MDEMLKTAAEAGDINMLYTLIRDDPYLLDRVDHMPFVETPLHIAATSGHTKFGMEIMRLKPSFARKPNHDGYSPLHLALQNAQTKMVCRLVDCESDLIRVPGREGKTPLHFVVEEGNLCLLSEFLSVCPQSIRDVTIGSETALHIAVKNFKFDAFDFLVGKLRRAKHRGAKIQEREILNWQDEEGNTVLHIAALTKQHKVIRVLVDCGVEVNVKNSEGLTALDISELQVQDHNREVIRKTFHLAGASNASSLPKLTNEEDTLHSRLSLTERLKISIVRYKKNMTSDTVHVQLVVAVLIATAAYQATLSPPGGLWQDNSSNSTIASYNSTASSVGNLAQNRAGKVIMGAGFFLCFWLFNTTALLTTTLAILFLIPTGYLSALLITPLCLFFCCYVLSMSIVSPSSAMSSLNFYLLLLFSSLLVIILTVMLSYRAVSKKLKRFLM